MSVTGIRKIQLGLEQLVNQFSFRIIPAGILLAAALTVLFWQNAQGFGSGSIHSLHMLEGGVLTLSLIVLVLATLKRSWLYILFAAWLVCNLRVATISIGWDVNWAGQSIPPEHLPIVRKLTIALYYVLNYSMFSALLKKDLQALRLAHLLRPLQLFGLLLLASALWLSYEQFMPIMGFLAGAGFALASYLLARALVANPQRKTLWYAFALGLSVAIGSGASNIVDSLLNTSLFSSGAVHIASSLASTVVVAIAIIESIQMERRERVQAEAELKGVYEVAPVGLFTLEPDGAFARANPALIKMLDLQPPVSAMPAWHIIFGMQNWMRLKNLANLNDGSEIEFSVTAPRHDEPSQRSFSARAVIANEKIEGSLVDITERADTMAKLRLQTNRDPLTNALNQKGFEKALNTALLALEDGKPFVLAYIDLDAIRTINELYGHAAGDNVLKQTCQRFQAHLSSSQLLGRANDGRFMLLFQNASLESAQSTAQALLDDLKTRPLRINDHAFKVGAFLGLVAIATPGLSAQGAITAAARAARIARKSGQNQLAVHIHDTHAMAQQNQELALLRDLGNGTFLQGLYLEMQPILSLKAPHDTLNFEVLLRMRDGSGAVIPTPKIIGAAEQAGTISHIDKWVLRTTLEWLDAHPASLSKTNFVCINLSGMSLNDESFIDDFFALLNDYPHLRHLLCLEITESVALQELNNSRRFVLRLQEMGMRVALDDFGAGYTSFSYLKELPANKLKIDGAFIRNMHDHPSNLAIVEAIITLARHLGMSSIAEWVEDSKTLNTLREMGVDYVQGYVVARPQSADRILQANSAASFITDEGVLRFIGAAPAQAQPAMAAPA